MYLVSKVPETDKAFASWMHLVYFGCLAYIQGMSELYPLPQTFICQASDEHPSNIPTTYYQRPFLSTPVLAKFHHFQPSGPTALTDAKWMQNVQKIFPSVRIRYASVVYALHTCFKRIIHRTSAHCDFIRSRGFGLHKTARTDELSAVCYMYIRGRYEYQTFYVRYHPLNVHFIPFISLETNGNGKEER